MLMMHGPKSRRLVVRVTARLRREGGSLIMSIPRNVVRHWKLEAGALLVVRSTERGILLYPRYSLLYISRAQRKQLFGRQPRLDRKASD